MTRPVLLLLVLAALVALPAPATGQVADGPVVSGVHARQAPRAADRRTRRGTRTDRRARRAHRRRAARQRGRVTRRRGSRVAPWRSSGVRFPAPPVVNYAPAAPAAAPAGVTAPAPVPTTTPSPTPEPTAEPTAVVPDLPDDAPSAVRVVSRDTPDMSFTLSSTTVKAGPVQVEFDNSRGEDPHRLQSRGPDAGVEFNRIEAEETLSGTFTLQPGTYTLFCPYGGSGVTGHEARGMHATLTVTP